MLYGNNYNITTHLSINKTSMLNVLKFNSNHSKEAYNKLKDT